MTKSLLRLWKGVNTISVQNVVVEPRRLWLICFMFSGTRTLVWCWWRSRMIYHRHTHSVKQEYIYITPCSKEHIGKDPQLVCALLDLEQLAVLLCLTSLWEKRKESLLCHPSGPQRMFLVQLFNLPSVNSVQLMFIWKWWVWSGINHTGLLQNGTPMANYQLIHSSWKLLTIFFPWVFSLFVTLSLTVVDTSWGRGLIAPLIFPLQKNKDTNHHRNTPSWPSLKPFISINSKEESPLCSQNKLEKYKRLRAGEKRIKNPTTVFSVNPRENFEPAVCLSFHFIQLYCKK